MKSKIAILLIIAFSFAASASSQVNKPQLADLIAVITHRDSTKELTVITRGLTKGISYDSVAKKDIVVPDTVWGRRYFNPIIDPKTKKQLILKGQPQFEKEARYIPVSKDSVRWRGIEGVPVDSLLMKKVPPRGY